MEKNARIKIKYEYMKMMLKNAENSFLYALIIKV